MSYQRIKKILLILLCFVVVLMGCAEEAEEEEKINLIYGVGTQMGDSVTTAGYDYNQDKVVAATVTPYQKGFKILFQPLSSHFICSVSNYVIQGGNQKDFDLIADSKSDFENYNFYNGYIESGAFDSCGYYVVDTVWVIYSDKLGFNPNDAYQVRLDDVRDYNNDPKNINIIPSK